jgi:hypothetical protein
VPMEWMNEYLTNNGTKSIQFATLSKLAVGPLLPTIHCMPGLFARM